MLFAYAQGASALHMLTARHARCAEHDELVELGDGPEAAPAVSQPRAAIASTDAALAGHHHCELAAVARHRTVLTDCGVRVVSVPAAEVLASRPVPAAHRPSAPLYRLAPKNSPPSLLA